jgi:hypothetical protein
LELAFATKAIRHVCESDLKAMRDLGIPVAARLRARVADLRAADTISDVPVATQPASDSTVEIDLGDGFKMLVGANHPVPPVLKSGATDWSQIRRIKILRIGR